MEELGLSKPLRALLLEPGFGIPSRTRLHGYRNLNRPGRKNPRPFLQRPMSLAILHRTIPLQFFFVKSEQVIGL